MNPMKQNIIVADDKVLHCISRMLQEGTAGNDTKCLYCKYAPECRNEFETTGNLLFFDILQELERKTAVIITLTPETIQKKILRGSWIEEHTDLLKKFTNMSFDEQQDNLSCPDILGYLHNPDS